MNLILKPLLLIRHLIVGILVFFGATAGFMCYPLVVLMKGFEVGVDMADDLDTRLIKRVRGR